MENKSFTEFFTKLYTETLSDAEVQSMYDVFKYQGFDRDEILKQMFEKLKDVKLISELIVLCAVQTPAKAAHQKMSNGLTPVQMGITASGQKGTKNLSCTRITAVTADLAAFYLKKIRNLPKKVGDSDLPAWLQFPSAASIDMPKKYRDLHKEFAMKFSERINISGEYPFNHDIYEQMQANSYLNERLGLFEDN